AAARVGLLHQAQRGALIAARGHVEPVGGPVEAVGKFGPAELGAGRGLIGAKADQQVTRALESFGRVHGGLRRRRMDPNAAAVKSGRADDANAPKGTRLVRTSRSVTHVQAGLPRARRLR